MSTEKEKTKTVGAAPEVRAIESDSMYHTWAWNLDRKMVARHLKERDQLLAFVVKFFSGQHAIESLPEEIAALVRMEQNSLRHL
jgi:hypothetical protein